MSLARPGRVGRHVASQLAAAGIAVRAVARDPETADLPANVDVVRADQIRADGVVRAPYGRAARSLIDERDTATVAVRALTEDGHDGNTYVLTGPATVTQAEQVHIIGAAIGRPLRWEEVPREVARAGLVEVFGTSRSLTAPWTPGQGL